MGEILDATRNMAPTVCKNPLNIGPMALAVYASGAQLTAYDA